MVFVLTILFTPTRKIALGIFAIGTGLLGINLCALFFLEYKKVLLESQALNNLIPIIACRRRMCRRSI